jgi:hypothetical protein
MSKFRTLVTITMLSLLASCTSNRVVTDFDPNQSFKDYKSFSWVSDQPMLVEGDRDPNPLAANRLMTAIQSEFESKGYEFVSSTEDADFIVSFTVGARNKVKISEHKVQEYIGPYDPYWMRAPLGLLPTRETTITETREYTEGMLAIDVFDVKNKKPVWHSAATKRLSRAELEESDQESIRGAVAAIAANFPPEPAAN